MPIDTANDTLEVALQKLQAKENGFRQLEEISGLGSWEINLETNKSIWSDQSYKIYGVDKTTTQPSLELFFSHLLPEDLEYVKMKIDEGISSAKLTTFNCKIKRGDGSIATLLLNGQAIYNNEKKPIKIIGTTQDITYQVTLKKKTQDLSAILEHSSNEIYIINFDTLDYLYVNSGATKATGYSSEEFLKMNIRDINPLLTEDEIHKQKTLLPEINYLLNRTTHQKKDGTTYQVQSHIHKISYNGQKSLVIFDTDISNIIELENKEKKQAKILEYIQDSIISTDIQGNITSWNRGSSTLFQYTDKEMINRPIFDIYHSKNSKTLPELFTILESDGFADTEAYIIKKDMTKIICSISFSLLKNEKNESEGYIVYIKNITEKRGIQEQLEKQTALLKYQAHHDVLTNLPNRALFKDRLSQAIISSKRNHEKFALLFIDLDQFKKINDSLGHHIGDEVLIESALRLKNTIRENDTLSRLGGDEFTIILKNIKDIQTVSKISQKIINAINLPIQSTLHQLHITSSIGISIYPDDATSDSNLIKYADVAMYKAKEEGRNNYQFYSSDMTAFAFERVVMENSLRIALKEEQFIVHYQPQVDTLSKKVVSMEALVRWKHPTLGIIPPIKFLPIAQESGLLVEIDRLVMKIAMREFKTWEDEGLNPGILSLNLTMQQLSTKDFLEYLSQTMKEIGFNSKHLEFEVTEGQVMSNPEASISKLNKLHELGISIAIDDFGTGYSSLSYLKKLPLDKLKIDRSFIQDIPNDEDDVAITKAIIALAKSLRLTLIAEGVETKEQRDFITDNGCELIQGYFYHKPLPSDEMQTLLATN